MRMTGRVLLPSRAKSRALLAALCLFVGSLGGALIYYGRFRMKGDGISYLDLADAYLRRDWSAAANTTWSPLYPVAIALLRAIIRPGEYYEIPVVHLTNFLIFLLALASFVWMLKQFPEKQPTEGLTAANYVVSFAVFSYVSLGLVAGPGVTPDMLLLAILIVICGLYLRMDQRGWTARRGFCLGVLLGIAYLTKAAFFPLSLVFLTILLCKKFWEREGKSVLVAAGAFFLVAAPWVTFLSYQKGRLTFSDIGWINYCIDVGGCQNDSAASYPLNSPGPILFHSNYTQATYPPWYDLSESRGGMRIQFSLRRQLTATKRATFHALEILSSIFALPVWLMLSGVGCFGFRRLRQAMRKVWPLMFLAASGVGLYLLTHIEERYLGPLLILLFLPFLIAMGSEGIERRSWLKTLVVLASVIIFGSQLYLLIRPRLKGAVKHEVYAAAQTASLAGFVEGDRVVVIGDGIRLYWPRLLRMHIVGEFQNPDSLWDAPLEEQRTVICQLKREGVTAVVTSLLKPKEDDSEWIEIEPQRSYALKTTCPKNVGVDSN